MATEFGDELDAADLAILAALQDDGRLSIAQLSRMVNMSASAVTERLRRLETSGVILGYGAVVDPARVGFTIMAYLRLRYPSSNYKAIHDLLDVTTEIIEAHHVTGDDCFILKVLARSMAHLEQISGRVGGLGSVTTSVVYSSPLPRRAVTPEEVVSRPVARIAPAGPRGARG